MDPESEIRVLLIEDNSDHAELIQEHFASVATECPNRVEWTDSIGSALELIAKQLFHAILLDLRLPDGDRLEDTVARIVEETPDTPVIVLTSLNDLNLALKAVTLGAQDYLVKSEANGHLLARAVHYAIERKRINAELARSNRALAQFAHTVAHELKSPLSAVVYGLETLKRAAERGKYENIDSVIGQAQTAAGGMARLVNDLLEFAQFDKAKVASIPTSADEAFRNSLAAIRSAVEESKAEIHCDVLPAVLAHATHLQQLFQNLLSNAIKHRGEQPLRIHVSAQRRDGQWLFSVHDNGPGIPAEDRERIFGMFERGAEGSNGAGIGLALCRRIVERHGGRIWVESEPGKGANFLFLLPAADRVETGQ